MPPSCCCLSFPTRRSSDLSGTRFIKLSSTYKAIPSSSQSILQVWNSSAHRCPPSSFTAFVDVYQAAFHLSFVPVATLAKIFPRDRKSTRLNSSHVKISYAAVMLLPLFPYTTLFRSQRHAVHQTVVHI